MPTPKNNSPVHVLTYGQDCLSELAAHIIRTHKDSLPNLTDVVILLSLPLASTHLRKHLLNHAHKAGYPALLGPEILTLTQWVSQQPHGERPVLTEHQRELMLVEALTEYPDLYGQGSPWTLADSLLNLFDELTEHHIHLPEEFEDFLQQLGDAYKSAPSENNNQLNKIIHIKSDGLTGEARLVHTLWQAWQQQMRDENVTDRNTSYLHELKHSQEHINPDHTYYMAGFSQFSPAESSWLKFLISQKNISLWLQGSNLSADTIDYHPDNAIQQLLTSIDQPANFPEAVDEYGLCLNRIFDATNNSLQDRAHHFAKEHPSSPMISRLSIFEAKSSEQEALAIDIQTRLWWLEGKQKIGIVTENRRLARRVRALLERAGIELQDAAGWALSTTSAAAVLERWLEAIEEDFSYQPLLDLLKSPFFQPKDLISKENMELDRENLLSTIYRFEQSVILKENIGNNLERYRKHTRYRQDRLTAELAEEYNDIYTLLDIIADAAKPLLPFLNGATTKDNHFTPKEIFNGLNKSLIKLGMVESFSADDAGRDVLDELLKLQESTSNSSLKMNWSEFRNWLGRTLECFNFQPNTSSNPVQLMSLSQSSLHQFDGLIIAGAERAHLPGKLNQSPFFNDGVRQALGLASRTEQLTQRFYQFRCMLESASNIVITRCTELNNEDIEPSPWLERIQSFHTIAYNNNLINKTLTEIVGKPETIITNSSAPLPKKLAANPTVQINTSLIPKTFSASGYQQLMNCPYQVFAARCLGLEPPETIREMLEKSDYGERVHLCLHAFHSGQKSLPGPYTQPINNENRDDAIQFLTTIAEAVFANDLEDNFLHRGWLKRWQQLITPYIDWQIKRQEQWRVETTETTVEAKLAGTDTMLRGRLDRVDVSTDSSISEISIIDYKTGNVAKEEDVLEGESIQLPFYALLAEQALQQTTSRVEYVSLDKDRVQTKTPLENDTLSDLSKQVGSRLAQLITELQSGAPITAWGDDATCKWCQMSGVCRKESWLDS